ncbi:MAG: DUF2304 domain-containing protein [Patescibacteria group bacterium]
MLIKLFLIVFILFVVYRVISRFYRREITVKELITWLVFWLLVGVAVVLPQTTDLLAAQVGVSRGADLLVYISVLALFYLVFRILVRLERLEHQITKITRHVALDQENKKAIKPALSGVEGQENKLE